MVFKLTPKLTGKNIDIFLEKLVSEPKIISKIELENRIQNYNRMENMRKIIS